MPVGGYPIKTLLEQMAERALNGVGDASLGEWREWTGRAFHLRRRLSEKEERMIGPAVDVRHLPEGRERFEAVRRRQPWVTEEMFG